MRQMNRCLIALISSLLLVACAELNPRTMSAIPAGAKLTLDEPFIYTHEFSMRAGPPATVWLVAGDYQAKLKDENGVYYFGPSKCHQVIDPVGKVHLRDECGIFVPFDARRPAEIFHIKGRREVVPLDKSVVPSASGPEAFTQVQIAANPQLGAASAGIASALSDGINFAIEEQRKGNLVFSGVLKADGSKLRSTLKGSEMESSSRSR